MKTLLFVCTGNTCRSPMAEGIMKYLLKKSEHSDKKIKVMSAGISVFQKEKANPKSIQVMEGMGINIDGHSTQALSQELVEQADLILTMTKSHRQQILDTQPGAEAKVFTLLEFIQEKKKNSEIDIHDPFGLPEENYRKTAEQLLSALEKGFPKIINELCP